VVRQQLVVVRRGCILLLLLLLLLMLLHADHPSFSLCCLPDKCEALEVIESMQEVHPNLRVRISMACCEPASVSRLTE
jgi:hypothetical protein